MIDEYRPLAGYSGRLLPWTTLAPKAALPLSVYLPACVIPRLLHEPSIAGRLPPATLTALRPVPCPSWRQGVEYWEHMSDDRRTWAKAHYPGADMFAAIECSRLAAPHLDRRTIGRLAALHSHAEWVATHAPTNPPPGYVPAPRTTTAPLTLCLPSPDLPPSLDRRSTESHGQQVRRARLTLGRSRTGFVRRRFAKKAEAAGISPHCTHCSTAAQPVDETIPHMLLACARHAAAREALVAALRRLQLRQPLSLATILVTSWPPPPLSGSQLPALLAATSRYLSAIHADRAREQLLPLDTG